MLNEKLMAETTSSKGKFHFSNDRIQFDPENKLYHHKWEVPSNTVGTMSSNPNMQIGLGPEDNPEDVAVSSRPRLTRPVSALVLNKPNLKGVKNRPNSASSLIFTFGSFNLANSNFQPSAPVPQNGA